MFDTGEAIYDFKKNIKMPDLRQFEDYREKIKKKLLDLIECFRKYPVLPVSFHITIVFPMPDSEKNKDGQLFIQYGYKFPKSYSYEDKKKIIENMKEHPKQHDFPETNLLYFYGSKKVKEQLAINTPNDENSLQELINTFFDKVSSEIQIHNPQILKVDQCSFNPQEIKYYIHLTIPNSHKYEDPCL